MNSVRMRHVLPIGLPLISMLLFWTLALHMYYALGDWPKSIGTRGFPPALYWHAEIATMFFYMGLLVVLFAVPLTVCCLLFKRTRHFAFYLFLFLAAALLSIFSMMLAPKEFMTWWLD